MTSLKKRVTSYLRQLSFHNEPRERKSHVHENSFITKYFLGQIKLIDGPPVLYGKSPNDLPNFELGIYTTGSESIVGCSTGPNGGLTTVKRIEKHLSVTDPDIDFIDTQEEIAEVKHKSPVCKKKPLDNSTMVIKVAGQEYRVTNRKSRSLGSLTDLTTVDSTEISNACCANNTTQSKTINNNNEHSEQCKNKNPKLLHSSAADDTACDENRSFNSKDDSEIKITERVNKNFSLSKSKSESNPFGHKKKGKIIRLTERPQAQETQDSNDVSSGRSGLVQDGGGDTVLPNKWNRKSDFVYGLSDSLYDLNQVTKCKNGNPIADCYGIIARNDSAILALADGVNWGEKACIAAKSAIHGCLHYLNKTIFDDTSLFDFDKFQLNQDSPINTTYISPDINNSPSTKTNNENRISNTTEVFISLLRALNCAHNLILENQGMLTTLTVAVVLPLKSSNYKKPPNLNASRIVNKDLDRSRKPPLPQHISQIQHKKRSIDGSDEKLEKYICCVCNVGDTLAYVYSQKYGLRELTKGSHDVYCNRDMRDALGALGPVDGINPELNNLTLSVTTLDAGDIIMIASDGLTDNYDPTVCKYTVNSLSNEVPKPQRPGPANVSSNKEKSTPRPSGIPRDARPPRERKSSTSSRVSVPSSNVSRLAKESQATSSTNALKSETSLSKNKENTPRDRIKTDQQSLDECDNPLIAQFIADNGIQQSCTAIDKPKLLDSSQANKRITNPRRVSVKTSVLSENKNKEFNPLMKSRSTSGVVKTKLSTESPQIKHGIFRSKTSIDFHPQPKQQIHRNEDGLPYVTPLQKYELTLLLIEDILKRGISGKERPCTTARILCENLLRYTVSVTAAKRHTLEDLDLYFENKNDILVEISAKEKKIRRRRCLEKVQNLPGKLDHVSVVAYNVGNQVARVAAADELS